MFKDMRARFCKKDSAVYFSHLDLNRAVMRALRRSGIPFWSTGGFSPHPYCIFAQPLSLGFESEGELFDFRVTDEFDPQALVAAFPESLKIMEIYEPEDHFKTIAWADYRIELRTEADAATIQKAFEGPLTVLKKTKRSEKEVDLREFIHSISAEQTEGGVTLLATVAAGNERSLSPNYLAEGLKNAGISAEIRGVCRLVFRKEDLNPIR